MKNLTKTTHNIRVDEITIGRSSNSSLDSHQAMFLGSLENCLRFKDFRMCWRIDVCTNPTNVFATSESPLSQTISAQVQSIRATTPQKHKASVASNLIDLQIENLIPIPKISRA